MEAINSILNGATNNISNSVTQLAKTVSKEDAATILKLFERYIKA